MSAKLTDLEGMPGWPLYLSREQAAAYLGVSEHLFDEEVAAGAWPAGERRGNAGAAGNKRARLTWCRLALEHRALQRANLAGTPATPERDWTTELDQRLDRL
jgi:hypothetical protein